MTREEYLKQRELYQEKASNAFENVTHKAYYAGLVRGLDLAFNEDNERISK